MLKPIELVKTIEHNVFPETSGICTPTFAKGKLVAKYLECTPRSRVVIPAFSYLSTRNPQLDYPRCTSVVALTGNHYDARIHNEYQLINIAAYNLMLNPIVFNLYVICKLCQFLCNQGSICHQFVLCINLKFLLKKIENNSIEINIMWYVFRISNY